jgi:hypothetical protein
VSAADAAPGIQAARKPITTTIAMARNASGPRLSTVTVSGRRWSIYLSGCGRFIWPDWVCRAWPWCLRGEDHGCRAEAVLWLIRMSGCRSSVRMFMTGSG